MTASKAALQSPRQLSLLTLVLLALLAAAGCAPDRPQGLEAGADPAPAAPPAADVQESQPAPAGPPPQPPVPAPAEPMPVEPPPVAAVAEPAPAPEPLDLSLDGILEDDFEQAPIPGRKRFLPNLFEVDERAPPTRISGELLFDEERSDNFGSISGMTVTVERDLN